MKTIYIAHMTHPQKIEIYDEQIEAIDQARDRIYLLIAENPLWRPSLEIDIPLIEPFSCGSEQITANVTWGSNRRDNHHSGIRKLLQGIEDRGFTFTGLGHNCYEGWEDVVDGKDFSELPNTYFEREFVMGFAAPMENRSSYDNWEGLVLPEHERSLADQVNRRARNHIRELRRWSRYGGNHEYYQTLIESSTRASFLAREIMKGTLPFSDLEAYCASQTRSEDAEGDSDELDQDLHRGGSPERM